MKLLVKALIFSILLIFILPAYGQKTSRTYDLKKLFKESQFTLFQRNFVESAEKTKSSVKLNESSGEGIAWINGLTFSEGIIEVDLKGKDEFQKSFLGIAFHGLNDSTYDAIYFRPFNFATKDSVRKIHAVQYISHPQYGWKKLREERNGEFEKSVFPVPNPKEWFHARVEIKGLKVSVYLNGSTTPSLEVNKLNERNTGRLGIWVGDGSGGEFANLIIKQ